MPEWLKQAWHDSVWSKVIAGIIIASLASIWAAIRFGLLERLRSYNKPKLTKIDVQVSPQPGKAYSLKVYVQLRNDFRKCVEVSLSEYRPEKITLKHFVPGTLQILFQPKWVPEPEAAERVAVLPGQMCRAWVGVDESKFNVDQVSAVIGALGILVLKVNRKDLPIQL
jgi:hypothetical protein